MTSLISGFMDKSNPTGAEPVPKAALWNETQGLKISVKPGETYLFRVANIGAFAGQYIWMEGHKMQIVEVDGVYTQQAEADMVYLSAAQRCSFLVTMKNDTSANFPMVASMDTVSSLFGEGLASPVDWLCGNIVLTVCSLSLIRCLMILIGTSPLGSRTTTQPTFLTRCSSTS